MPVIKNKPEELEVVPAVPVSSDVDHELSLLDDDLLSEVGDEEEVQPVAPLKLTDLFEEKRLQFELEPGKIIFFIDPRKISAQDTARMMKLQKLTEGAMKAMQRNANDGAAVARFEQVITTMVKFILPDLPDNVLAPLTYAQRAQIVQYWSMNTDFGAGKKAQPGS